MCKQNVTGTRSKNLSGEIQSMCNLSMGVLFKGEMKKAKEMAYKLIDMDMTCEEIAEMAEVDVKTVQEWLEEREGMIVK